MPLSFRRSYKKRPGSEISRKESPTPKAPTADVVRSSGKFRAARYPLVIPIGCGLAAGLCLFGALSQGLIRWPRGSPAAPPEYGELATAAFETALVDQLSTVAAMHETDTAEPKVTPIPPAVATQVTSVEENPWAAEVSGARCIPADLPQTGRVVEVVDGDTIKVLLDADARVHSVRYLGAEAPSINGATASIGLEAMRRNAELVYWRQAVLVRDITDSDVNGTLLRYVMVDDVFVNQAMIAEGLAKSAFAEPDTACRVTFQSAEQQARALGLGLWASSAH
jgi:micrococcal nuclease